MNTLDMTQMAESAIAHEMTHIWSQEATYTALSNTTEGGGC